MKNEFFGLKKLLTTEEFNSFYLATGIDVDGRMEMIKKAIEQIQHGLMKYISFARIIPGFEDLPTDDKLALIKGKLWSHLTMLTKCYSKTYVLGHLCNLFHYVN